MTHLVHSPLSAARIESEDLRKSKKLDVKIKEKQTVICHICKYKVGEQLISRKFITINEFHIHKGGTDQITKLIRLEKEHNHYYCNT